MTFNLDYAPHFGMFKESAGDSLVEQLRFAADQGFRAWEDNGLKGRSPETQNQLAAEMEKLNIRMGVFVAHSMKWNGHFLAPGNELGAGDPDIVDNFLAQIRDSVELAKRFNAKWMTVVPGNIVPSLHESYQTANVVDALRRASDILEPHGLTMVLEPLNHYVNHPNLFLSTVAQGYMICRAVNSPACKVLYDMYHQQIQEGNIIQNIDLAWSEIGYFQIGDTPGRKEPTTGEMNYRGIFKHIHSKGFKGILGMEHGNSKPGKAGEQAVIDAYRQCDAFDA
ncbi:hydroxypyruvate isomerase family protein [Hirschia litorea]|uniref:Hydroxypyruvate isomerase family protein n=1 Tax=Hirschia litorea TaxID=1199156 RepID=A0ABW2INW4_9PROT